MCTCSQKLLRTVVEKCTCVSNIHQVLQFVGNELLQYQIPPEYVLINTVKLGYSVPGLYDTSAITLHTLRRQLTPHETHAFLPCLVRHT
jgi:hypothetical protein